jgi:hypothetical protein
MFGHVPVHNGIADDRMIEERHVAHAWPLMPAEW